MNPVKNPHAVALGRKGGKAGTGKSKRRGSSDYYRQMAEAEYQAQKAEEEYQKNQ